MMMAVIKMKLNLLVSNGSDLCAPFFSAIKMSNTENQKSIVHLIGFNHSPIDMNYHKSYVKGVGKRIISNI
jgi:hypothetical protein